MLSSLAALFVALSLAPQTVDHPRNPCRRSHCTLAGEDLALIIALATFDFASTERVRVAAGVELEIWDAFTYLSKRHEQGHGGWPDDSSPKTLVDLGLAGCDPGALEALRAVGYTNLGQEQRVLDAQEIARWLECNGRFFDSEELFRAAIPADSKPEDEVAWQLYGKFLARRGRFEQALPLIEPYEEMAFCGMAAEFNNQDKFDWVEFCCNGLHGGTCDEFLFEKRMTIVGISGLAEYVANRNLERKSTAPELEARLWFESAIARADLEREQADCWKECFLEDLEAWTKSRSTPPSPDSFDWARPEGVARAVALARDVANSDPRQAYLLLDQAAATGNTLAGLAVVEFLANRSIAWDDDTRRYLKQVWSDAILLRTFGCADPENPKTW